MHSKSFRERIKSLKGHSASHESRSAAVPPLSDRIARLKVRTSLEATGLNAALSDAELAQQLGGRVISAGLIVVDHVVCGSHTHGSSPVAAVHRADMAALFAPPQPVDQLLFIDTETTGLAGGTGTLAFLIGLLRAQGDGLCLRQYLLTAFDGERAMFEDLGRWLRGNETLVSFNGKSFDAPLLAARHRLCGMGDPLHGLLHWDLMHPTRRAFGSRWPDCRLATAERHLLGFLRENDLASAEVPQVWFEFVRFGQAARIPAVLRHNYWDLLSLALLLPALARVFASPELDGADAVGVARHALQGGDEAAAVRHLERQRAALDERGLLELARLYRRHGERERAVAVWQELAERNCVEALEHLAKYHEHGLRDPQRALAMTERLLVLAPRLPNLHNRYDRLRRKCRGTA